MSKLLVLSLSLCFLLFSGCFAYRLQPQENDCQLERLNALEPDNQIKSEAGLIETWNPTNKQLRWVGVALSRCTLLRNCLGRPFYTNAPQEFYIQQGSGIFGIIFLVVLRLLKSHMNLNKYRTNARRHSHQKVHHFREGDVIAVPTGVAFWMYNNEDTPVVAVSLIDTSNLDNQLDQMPRRFYLSGNQEHEFLKYQQQQPGCGQSQQGRRGQQEEEENEGGNILRHFNKKFLEEAFDVDKEIVRRLQGDKDDGEGSIVKVEGDLSVINPPTRQQLQEEAEEEEEEEQQQQGQQERERRRRRGSGNGLEETVCTMRLHLNIGESTNPDIYNPQAGRIKTLTSLDLPIFWWLGLSAEHGSLYKHAMFAPHYNLNANSMLYALKGRAWLQVIDCSGNAVFDGELNKTWLWLQSP